MTDRRIIDVQTASDVSGAYIMTDSSTAGVKKYAVASLIEDACDAAGAVAAAAIDELAEFSVPLMSATTRGGAKLGYGLAIDENGALYVSLPNADEVSY